MHYGGGPSFGCLVGNASLCLASIALLVSKVYVLHLASGLWAHS